MSHMSLVAKLAATAIALGMLAGCGKTAAVAPAPVIDSVFSKMPAKAAQPEIAKQQQDQQDQSVRQPQTTKVGAPSDERAGFTQN